MGEREGRSSPLLGPCLLTLPLGSESSFLHSSVTLLLSQSCPRQEKVPCLWTSMQCSLELSHSHQSQNQRPSCSCQRAMCHPRLSPPGSMPSAMSDHPPKDPSLSNRIPGSWVPRAGLFLLASFLVSTPKI